jgi:hypothetical protein
MRRVLAVLLWLYFAPALLRAQELQRVPVRVTFVAGGQAYIDRGREAGIQVGDTVVLNPPGLPPVRTRVVSVAATSARLDIPALPAALAIGTTGEAQLPAGRVAPSTQPASQAGRPVPEHPPWTQPIDPREREHPLLAPAFGRGPEERPIRIDGRVYARSVLTQDDGADRDARYFVGNLGTDFEVENLLGDGGRLQFDGEVASRESRVPGVIDEDETDAWINRFSYRTGGNRHDRHTLELGRFQQGLVPELGVVDGIEASWLTAGLGTLGVSGGFFPEPFPEGGTTDDLQLAVVHKLSFDEHQRITSSLALQKTWHDGAPDRDLLLWIFEARPSDRFWFHAATWIDFYTSSDVIKSSGLELTEQRTQLGFTPRPETGASLGFSYQRWPELKRREFAALPPDLIRDGHVVRGDLSLWNEWSKCWRTDLRGYLWEDQDSNGLGGDLRLTARELLDRDHEASLDLFYSEGSFLEGPGFRLASRHRVGSSYLSATYELGLFEATRLVTGTSNQTQHALIFTGDFPLGDWSDLSLSLDWRGGDGVDAITLGFYVQTRF